MTMKIVQDKKGKRYEYWTSPPEGSRPKVNTWFSWIMRGTLEGTLDNPDEKVRASLIASDAEWEDLTSRENYTGSWSLLLTPPREPEFNQYGEVCP